MKTTSKAILLNHKAKRVAIQIHSIFQSAYKIEAGLIGVEDFPPLRRTVQHIKNSSSRFFGYKQANRILGIIEIDEAADKLSIESLAVKPGFFGKGIGQSLVAFVLEFFNPESVDVQTASANKPAIRLYEKLGFSTEKSWSSKEGIKLVQLRKINTQWPRATIQQGGV